MSTIADSNSRASKYRGVYKVIVKTIYFFITLKCLTLLRFELLVWEKVENADTVRNMFIYSLYYCYRVKPSCLENM